MKKDIRGRADIALLVDEFYKKIKLDPVIGYIFSDIAKVNLDKHLPVMYDFFENMLFYTGSYNGNPMQLHKHLNSIVPLTVAHFDQWYYLFSTTVDGLFTGETASLAKQRAKSIATVMQIKIREGQSLPDRAG